MRFFGLFVCVLSMVSFSLAVDTNLFFKMSGGELCASKQIPSVLARNASGNICGAMINSDVRARVLGAPKNSSQTFGFDVVRPFFILDGIYLDPTGVRTLAQFQEETEQFGLTDVLTDLGYTPILVQFSESVHHSLKRNADFFAEMLKFFSRSKVFGFADRMTDGFVVLGISQGGILGRYGAYSYSVTRKSTDVPVRLFASLDSPHQGAVLPKSLLYTIDFWAKEGGSAAAESFNDIIKAPGAQDLLIILPSKEKSKTVFKENFSTDRFLFGDYRKAAEYKGFPAVLISQGQLKGKSLPHSNTFFKLNRKATKVGTVMGRAESRIFSSKSEESQLAFNRIYKKISEDTRSDVKESSRYDFVQGSTYPFSAMMYQNLREGFLDALPNGMSMTLFSIFGQKAKVSLSTSWDEDSLYQGFSTFIPVASAMDLKCDGKLGISQECAFNQSSSGFPFANPGNRSSGVAAYAVDPLHPRYNETSSGRHIELPFNGGTVDSAVLRGMQVDMWRVLCEVAKADYDSSARKYRNPDLSAHFTPEANCVDPSQMPLVIKNAGITQRKSFGYARYDYNSKATEKNTEVNFELAAGWHRVAWFDNGSWIPGGSAFEVDVQVQKSKGNWMKAELLLHQGKNNGGQLQLSEISVPVDGRKHRIRWSMPFASGSENHYRWFRLVLNSDGGRVTLSNPRLILKGFDMDVPQTIKSNTIYPNGSYSVIPWNQGTQILSNGSDMNILFKSAGNGLRIQFEKMQSLKTYSKLKVVYAPGTCQNTAVYFDSFKRGQQSLAGGVAENGNVVKRIPLQEIVDTQVTPNFSLSALGLSLHSLKAAETCVIHKILLE